MYHLKKTVSSRSRSWHIGLPCFLAVLRSSWHFTIFDVTYYKTYSCTVSFIPKTSFLIWNKEKSYFLSLIFVTFDQTFSLIFFQWYCIVHWWLLSESPWDLEHREFWGKGSGVLLDLHTVIFFKKPWDRIICRCFPLGNKKLIPPNKWCVSGLNREHQFYEVNFLKKHGK